MVKSKTTKGFNDSLTLYSLFGFIALVLLYFFQIDIGDWGTTALMVLTGGALLLEGHIITIKHWGKDGIQGKKEFTWLITIVAGLFILLVGFLKSPMFNFGGVLLDSAVGYVSMGAVLFILWQKYIVD